MRRPARRVPRVPRRTPLVRRRPTAGGDHPRGRTVIRLEDVHRIYQLGEISVPALRGVTLTVERGDFVAIMGSSGSGKSTLMNILGCLDAPTRGSYMLDGVDVRQFDDDDLADVRNRKLGFVFQSYNLVPRTSALANVELPLAYAGLDRAERRRRATAALGAVGMADRLHHVPSELSGGQQQRVAVARALVTHPALMLADEPTGNLDSHSTAEILAMFDELNRQGHTIVLITHEPDVAAHAKRIVHLADGQLVDDRRVADVTDPPPGPRRPVTGHAAGVASAGGTAGHTGAHA